MATQHIKLSWHYAIVYFKKKRNTYSTLHTTQAVARSCRGGMKLLLLGHGATAEARSC